MAFSTLSAMIFPSFSSFGYPFLSAVSSETEAKKLIEEAEKEKKSSNDEESDKKDTTAEENLYNDIKNLARKIGINVNKSENIEDIFDKISQKLDEFEENSYNSNLNVFQSELDILKRQFKNMYSGESSILSAMDMISKSNRAALGI